MSHEWLHCNFLLAQYKATTNKTIDFFYSCIPENEERQEVESDTHWWVIKHTLNAEKKKKIYLF